MEAFAAVVASRGHDQDAAPGTVVNDVLEKRVRRPPGANWPPLTLITCTARTARVRARARSSCEQGETVSSSADSKIGNATPRQPGAMPGDGRRAGRR